MVSQSRRTVPSAEWCWWDSHGRLMSSPGHVIRWKRNMKQTQTIPETFLGVGYTRDQAGLPLEAVRVPVPRPAADQVLIRVAASSLNPLEYKLADPGLSRCLRQAIVYMRGKHLE